MFILEKECKVEYLENGVMRRIKGYLDDLMIVELTWKNGMVGTVHSHPHRQCGYIIQGSFEGEVSGEKVILHAGDCFYAKAGEPHGLVALEDDSVCIDIFTPKRDDFLI